MRTTEQLKIIDNERKAWTAASAIAVHPVQRQVCTARLQTLDVLEERVRDRPNPRTTKKKATAK